MTLPEPLSTLRIGAYGDIKTAKTTFGLTQPQPFVVFDFDQSFERAEAKFRHDNPDSKIIKVRDSLKASDFDNDVVVRKYRVPLPLPNKPLDNFDLLWDKTFIPEIIMVAEHPRIRGVFVDTGTIFWQVNRMAQLERAQKRSTTGRDNLTQIEYARPNTEASSILNMFQMLEKNLIISHHLGTKYGMGLVDVGNNKREWRPNQPIGDTWEGFKHMGAAVDVVGRNYLEITCTKCQVTFPDTLPGRMEHYSHPLNEKPVPTIVIEECGFTLTAKGKKLTNPTFKSVLGLVNILRTSEFSK